MAESNSDCEQLTNKVINIINGAKTTLRSMAQAVASQLSRADSIIVNPEKKALLVKGLNSKDIDPVQLGTEKDSLQAVCAYVLDHVEALTE